MLLLSSSPAPDSTSKAAPRSLGIGERSPQGLPAASLPLLPTYNLNPRRTDTVVFPLFPSSWWLSLTLQSPPPSGPRVRLCPLCLRRSALSMGSCPRLHN